MSRSFGLRWWTNDEFAVFGLDVHVKNDLDRAEGFFDVLDLNAPQSVRSNRVRDALPWTPSI